MPRSKRAKTKMTTVIFRKEIQHYRTIKRVKGHTKIWYDLYYHLCEFNFLLYDVQFLETLQ